MNILNFQLPKINPSFMWTIPSNLTQSAWNSFSGLKFQMPRIEGNLFRSDNGTKSRVEMSGNLKVANFKFEKSVKFSKQASYAR